MPIISTKSPNATSAAMAASFSAAGTSAAVSGSPSRGTPSLPPSNFFDFGPAEQAGWQEDQDDNENGEGGDVLIFDGKVSRPHRFDQPDQNTADHGSGQRSDAAEHGGGEGFHAGEKADEEIHHAIIKQEHQAGDRGQGGADDERQRNGAVDV